MKKIATGDCVREGDGGGKERREKKVPFPIAKTRNYVYYAIRRAHVAFYSRGKTSR